MEKWQYQERKKKEEKENGKFKKDQKLKPNSSRSNWKSQVKHWAKKHNEEDEEHQQRCNKRKKEEQEQEEKKKRKRKKITV